MTEIQKKVDSDWKKKAAQEKQQLANKKKLADAKAARETKDGAGAEAGPSILDLIRSLAMQAQFALGAPDPRTGQRRADPAAAQYAISLLEVLFEKTEGNLDERESSLLENAINELKMAFGQVFG